jgi:hypothetical protein
MQHLLCHSSLASASPSKQDACIGCCRLDRDRPRLSPCRHIMGMPMHLEAMPAPPSPFPANPAEMATITFDAMAVAAAGSPTSHRAGRRLQWPWPSSPDRAQNRPTLPPLVSGSAASPCPTSPPRRRTSRLLRHAQPRPRPPVPGRIAFLLPSRWGAERHKSPPPPSPASPGFVRPRPRGATRGGSRGEGWRRRGARVSPPGRPKEATRGAWRGGDSSSICEA